MRGVYSEQYGRRDRPELIVLRRSEPPIGPAPRSSLPQRVTTPIRRRRRPLTLTPIPRPGTLCSSQPLQGGGGVSTGGVAKISLAAFDQPQPARTSAAK